MLMKNAVVMFVEERIEIMTAVWVDAARRPPVALLNAEKVELHLACEVVKLSFYGIGLPVSM